MAQPTFIVKIQNRQKVIFEGEALALTADNEAGPFDVLSRHANFVSIIKNFLVLHRSDKKFEKIEIKSGILRVWNNQASVFLDISSPLSQPEIFSSYTRSKL